MCHGRDRRFRTRPDQLTLAEITSLMRPRFGAPSTGFWIFDNELESLETPTAGITVTRPSEVTPDGRMFDLMKGTAVHGPAARELINKIVSEIV